MTYMSIDKNILVVGELNIDLILNGIKGFPVVGSKIMADNMNLTLGSSSAIFAANISNAENTCCFLRDGGT